MLRPRTNAEAHLYMDLHPCPDCGTSEFDRDNALVERGGELVSVFDGACRGCGKQRSFEFAIADDLTPAAGDAYWGGSRPSAIICPGQFLSLADDCAHRVPAAVDGLDDATLARARRDLETAIVAMEEVLKFIPAGRDDVPRHAFQSAVGKALLLAEPGRFRRVRLEAVIGAYRGLASGFPLPDAGETSAEREAPPACLSAEVLDRHAAWVKRGMSGSGKLSLEHSDLTGARLDQLDLSGATLVSCALDGASLVEVHLRSAALTRCTAERCVLTSADLGDTALIECRFSRADLRNSSLEGAILEGGDFQGAVADRGAWDRLTARHVDFRETVFGGCGLDGAVFEDCDFRDADLTRADSSLVGLGTTANATFRRCDLRGARLGGRRLDGTRFLDCKLHGVAGTPEIEGDYVVERPDFSEAGDGSDVRGAAAVHALWGLPTPR